MTEGAPDVESPQDVSRALPEIRRERVVVRRRRARSRRHHRVSWSARASRSKIVRAFVVCASVLVLMALGLYFGLSRQEMAPPGGALHQHAVALSAGRA